MVQSQGGGLFTAEDAEANLRGKASRPLDVFKEYEVKTLKRFPNVDKGSLVWMRPMPHGFLYLVLGGVGCFCSDAKEGRDFAFVDDAPKM